MSTQAPCPATEDVGPYHLTCVLPAGHEGCHWCADIEDRVAADGQEDAS